MIVLAAAMIARTLDGAPLGTAASPLRRIIAVLPGTVGVFETGSVGIWDQGFEGGALTGGDCVQTCGVSCGSPWSGCCGCCAGGVQLLLSQLLSCQLGSLSPSCQWLAEATETKVSEASTDTSASASAKRIGIHLFIRTNQEFLNSVGALS